MREWLMAIILALGVGNADAQNVATMQAQGAEALVQTRRPLVIGHRGLPVLAPENTLPSFQYALAAGADLVELDCYQAKDGGWMVIHDQELDRTTDAVQRWGQKQVSVTSRTLAELKGLDAGVWFQPQYRGVPLPSLAEALDLIQKQGVTLIERKGGDPAALAAFLREKQAVNRVVVQSFDWTFLRQFHTAEPRQVLGALGPPGSHGGKELSDAEKALNQAWVMEVKGIGAKVVVWNRQVSKEAVALAHRQGLKVWVYTINEGPLANQLLDAGVDGLITDNAAAMWRTMALRRHP
jgi:glycerophosphoryl diester phosphodiesterase